MPAEGSDLWLRKRSTLQLRPRVSSGFIDPREAESSAACEREWLSRGQSLPSVNEGVDLDFALRFH
jgi:hypothetical protein